jgi:hypothetical protein
VFQKEIDPRITEIINTTSIYTVNSILIGLEHMKLVEPIPGNDWQLCGDLTQEGFNQITDATCVSIEYVLKHARVNLPLYISINENIIAASLIENAGLPQIRKIEDNELEIEFIGPQPLIRKINSYLDPQKVNANHVKNIIINPIALIFESPSHLN